MQPPPTVLVTPATPAPDAAPPSPAPSPLKGDPVVVELLLVSGRRHRWTFGSENSVEEAKRRVWKEWPQEWQKGDPRPASPDALRFLYLGRFLDDPKTLEFYKLSRPLSSDSDSSAGPPIVHLHIRTISPPEGASQLF
ncbi:hypothetical protein JCM8547_001491 [Rhodosporidiobolus lusitaniae]